MQKVVKAVAGAVASSSGALATAYVTIPAEVQMPWWGYILVGVVNAGLGFGVVYFAPRNQE